MEKLSASDTLIRKKKKKYKSLPNRIVINQNSNAKMRITYFFGRELHHKSNHSSADSKEFENKNTKQWKSAQQNLTPGQGNRNMEFVSQVNSDRCLPLLLCRSTVSDSLSFPMQDNTAATPHSHSLTLLVILRFSLSHIPLFSSCTFPSRPLSPPSSMSPL